MAAGTTDLRRGWFCDHSPGRGKLITGAGFVGAAGYYYVETKLLRASSTARACIGVANASFDLTNPAQLDVASVPAPALAGGVFYGFADTGDTSRHADAWAGTTLPRSPIDGGSFYAGNTIGLAINTVNGLLWIRDVTADPTLWFGATGAGTPNPVGNVQGYDFRAGTSLTQNVFVLAGASQESGAFAELTINFGSSPFAATAPAGYRAWDTSTNSVLNSSDAAPQIQLSSAGLGMTTTTISGTNGPTAFVRSNTSKQQS